MTDRQRRELRKLEGRSVSISLVDGSRLDCVSLVSARGSTVWVFACGEDVFVPVHDVVDVWETELLRPAA